MLTTITDLIYHLKETNLKNIYLVGMAGVGKTTLGTRMSKTLSTKFLDTDIIFEKKTQKTIPTFFKEYSESKFRYIEKEIIHNTQEQQTIIATGGGAICCKENLKFMKSQGLIIWIQSSLSTISSRIYQDIENNKQRPLQVCKKYKNTKNKIEKYGLILKKTKIIYDKRKSLYATADFRINT